MISALNERKRLRELNQSRRRRKCSFQDLIELRRSTLLALKSKKRAREEKSRMRWHASSLKAVFVCHCVGRSVGPRGGKVMHHRGCMVWLVPNYEDTGSPVTPYSVGANLGVIKDK